MYITVLVPAEHSTELVPIRSSPQPPEGEEHESGARARGGRGRVSLKMSELEDMVRQCGGDADSAKQCLETVQDCVKGLDMTDPRACR